MTAIDIGISKENRTEISEGLKRLLADSYTLYLQTHNFHWNVTGSQFRELHLMFEEHYTELAIAVDDIADVDNVNSHWHCLHQNPVLLQEWRGYYGCGYGYGWWR